MSSIWTRLVKPLFIQAPMEDVTDTAFRQIIALCGKPDIYFTEFTNADGLVSAGHDAVVRRLVHTGVERPIIAQIWGNNPYNYFKAAQLIKKMGFDGIDINMGCPDRIIVKKGSCSGLINNPKLAKEIIVATKKGANGLPVSVKTRIGYNSINIDEWFTTLLSTDLDAITIHGRTAKEMSKVPVHWEEMGKIVNLRDTMKKKSLIIGNGDIVTRADAYDKINKYKLDGVMIGRGLFSNLWIFNENVKPDDVSFEEKVMLLKKHLLLYKQTYGDTKKFDTMKKFYKVYISGIPNASELRLKLMECKTIDETLSRLVSLGA